MFRKTSMIVGIAVALFSTIATTLVFWPGQDHVSIHSFEGSVAKVSDWIRLLDTNDYVQEGVNKTPRP